MHAALEEFNQNYAATMTAEAYAKYASLSCLSARCAMRPALGAESTSASCLHAWECLPSSVVTCDRYMQGRSGSLGVPERFADASLWRWRRKYEHPVYMTSNNEYGAKPPSQQMLPLSWHGAKGEFTRNYIKAEVRTGNFSTGLPTSRVHDALTELC